MDTTVKRPGLTGFQLKYLALALMVLDHIHYFFTFTGVIPEWFSMLGRLSAPLFLFCMVEGFLHTQNRKKYFLRLYLVSCGMGILQYIFSFVPALERGDGFYPMNAIFQNYVILVVVLQGIEWCRAKQWKKGLPAILVPAALPYLAELLYVVSGANPVVSTVLNLLHFSVLPMWSWIYDGGLVYIVEGILLYCFHRRRTTQVLVFAAVNFLYYGVFAYFAVPGATVLQMFTTYYEWMGSFAAVLMLMYNGQKGTGSKKLFYIFYPAHVYILYAASCLVWLLMR